MFVRINLHNKKPWIIYGVHVHPIDSKSVQIQYNRLCVVNSTNLDAKLGVGGKLFSSFCYNQNCSGVSILVTLL